MSHTVALPDVRTIWPWNKPLRFNLFLAVGLLYFAFPSKNFPTCRFLGSIILLSPHVWHHSDDISQHRWSKRITSKYTCFFLDCRRHYDACWRRDCRRRGDHRDNVIIVVVVIIIVFFLLYCILIFFFF